MTIEELYGRVLADDGLKQSLAEAAKAGKVAEWAAARGVEATEEELLAYVKATTESVEISDEDLEKVASGGYGTGILSAFFAMYCHMEG